MCDGAIAAYSDGALRLLCRPRSFFLGALLDGTDVIRHHYLLGAVPL